MRAWWIHCSFQGGIDCGLKEVTTGKVLLVDQATDPPELGRVTYVDWEPEAATLLPA